MRVIFMGTPTFAVPALSALIAGPNYEVVAVYTKAPKVAGRGLTLLRSPIHDVAATHNIQVVTPVNFRTAESLDELKSFNADVIVVSAYGLILPTSVLTATKHGCINIHPSDLPRWRGAAPIQRTIAAGDKETALCIMKMDEGLDTGDIILRHPLTIDDDISASELSVKMAEISAVKLLAALDLIKSNTATFTKQPTIGATYATKITQEEERIDWNKSAFTLFCQIRALSPRPGAYFEYNGEIIKIIDSTYDAISCDTPPGTVLDSGLRISCRHGTLTPKLLQRQGRKMIYTDAFLRGFPIDIGALLK